MQTARREELAVARKARLIYRFADDAILCFQHKEDAEKVLEVLPKRFEKYGLTLHPETRRRHG